MNDGDWITRTLACERCGGDFGCGAGGRHCWCVETHVPPEVLPLLKQRFGDCLCPACLKTLAAELAPVARAPGA